MKTIRYCNNNKAEHFQQLVIHTGSLTEPKASLYGIKESNKVARRLRGLPAAGIDQKILSNHLMSLFSTNQHPHPSLTKHKVDLHPCGSTTLQLVIWLSAIAALPFVLSTTPLLSRISRRISTFGVIGLRGESLHLKRGWVVWK